MVKQTSPAAIKWTINSIFKLEYYQNQRKTGLIYAHTKILTY